MPQSPSLAELENRDDFIHRHIGPSPDEQQTMLAALGVDSLDALTQRVVPEALRSHTPLALRPPRPEAEVLAELKQLADDNQIHRSFIGMGYYNTHTPGVILRNILENPGWYTAYTPYQPEISQGRLEALINYQTLITDLTGLDIANASLLDEATAAAEAMALCHRQSKSKRSLFFVDQGCHPQTLAVLRTRARPLGIELKVGNWRELDPTTVFGALVQYPDTHGEIHDFRQLAEDLHQANALLAVATDLLALTLLSPPGEWGADVAVGSSQRFGVPLGYGGPHAAFFATRDAFKRAIPGRLVGVSVDTRGETAYRLALQTREQHIRREKATSNICTAQVLLAVMAGMYAVYHGPEGLRTIARRTHRYTTILAEGLRALGLTVKSQAFFDTLTVSCGDRTQEILSRASDARINLRRVNDTTLGLSLDETVTRADLETLWRVFGDGSDRQVADLENSVTDALPTDLLRQSTFLQHPTFHRYHSETEMLRYLRSLMNKDLALDQAMIPLGSCTMKLNASTEMLPVSWPGFAQIHPFVPPAQAAGYRRLISDLESWLAACTGFDGVSLQPNSGAQGEYAGLLAIRAYHEHRNQSHRNICLIPSSAHGTNPASAMMAGMQVVVVACDDQGNVDVADLRAKAEKHAEALAALMITYPSTHGVFEEAIREICQIIHDQGGQVYMDGANLNALVGICSPADFGADVCHLNLHKTFCIPHGGGGPGVGPIAVAAHLSPHLPATDGPWNQEARMGQVSAAPFGSAGILPITWAYIALMGAEGLCKATQSAILNANYIAHRLKDHYRILYTGPNAMVAHECIVDLRPLKESAGITVDDVAKRLIDFGFHAPTMSWPVSGTLMIEPTESESQEELDRFCEAMITIREEIRAVEEGKLDVQDNPLKNAPHTVADLSAERWNHAYSREQAAYPVVTLRHTKYWSPVGRVDNVYGDRNLACACPPLTAYEDQVEDQADTTP